MTTYQAVLIHSSCNDISTLVNKSVQAGIEIFDPYNTDSTNFVGEFEKTNFQNMKKKWIEEGIQRNIYSTDNFEVILQIEYLANLESIPVSFINEDDPDVLVIGPWHSDRMDYLLQQCNKL